MDRTPTLVYLAILALAVSACVTHELPPAPSPSSDRPTFTSTVLRVSDADTVTVLAHGKTEKVRLNAIDCPESNQPFGPQATLLTTQLALEKVVTVIDFGRDKYQRLLGEIVLPDGRLLGRELVREGFCWWYRKFSPENTTLEKLETEAKEARKGLWADPNPIPPWEWRKAQRSPKNPSPSVPDLTNSQDHINIGVIGNQNSHRYHRPDCPGYGQIAPQNRVEFASESEAEAAGYRRAGNCP